MTSVREERAFWAHQLHAGLLNTIGAAVVQSQVCEHAIRSSLPTSIDEVVRLGEMLRTLEGAARAMASAAAAPGDLVPEVRRRTAAFARAHPEVRVGLTARGRSPRPSPRVAAGVVIVLVESLANAAKHGRPRAVDVDLAVEQGAVLLRIRDDGAGFEPALLDLPDEAPEGRPRCGIAIMRQWAGVLGGRLVITSVPGRGTQISLHVPPQPRAVRRAAILSSLSSPSAPAAR